MKNLQLATILLIICCSSAEIKSLPIEDQHQVAVLLLVPDNVQADVPASPDNHEKSVVPAVPLTLMDLEDADKTSDDAAVEYQRSTRGLGLSGLGGLGGFSNKFGGLGLGFKGLGGLGSWNLGGLHGLGLGGYKPFFGKYFG